MGLDPQHHVQVAWGSASHAGLSLTRQADLRTRVDAGRDLDRDPPGPLRPPLPAALGARALEDAAGAAAGRARNRRDDLAEERLRRPPHLAGSAASGARLGARPGLGARARAAIAGGQPRHVDLLFNAGECFIECDAQVVAKVVA